MTIFRLMKRHGEARFIAMTYSVFKLAVHT